MEAIRVLQSDGRVIHVQTTLQRKPAPMAQRRAYQVWMDRAASGMTRYLGCNFKDRRK